MFFSAACGYVLSLGSFSFDVVIPALFLWAAVAGIVLNFVPIPNPKRLVLDCSSVAAAFVASPILFTSLRGLLAYHAGELPNLTLTLGYGALSINQLDPVRSFLSAAKWFLVLFAISLPLVLLGTIASGAFVQVAKRVFRFGPENVERTRTLLLKIGALVAVIASAVAIVATFSRARASADLDSREVPSGSYQGTLNILRPDRDRLVGDFHIDGFGGESIKVLVKPQTLGTILDPEKLAAMRQHPCHDGHQYSHKAACYESEIIDDVVVEVSHTIFHSGLAYGVVTSVKRSAISAP